MIWVQISNRDDIQPIGWGTGEKMRVVFIAGNTFIKFSIEWENFANDTDYTFEPGGRWLGWERSRASATGRRRDVRTAQAKACEQQRDVENCTKKQINCPSQANIRWRYGRMVLEKFTPEHAIRTHSSTFFLCLTMNGFFFVPVCLRVLLSIVSVPYAVCYS